MKICMPSSPQMICRQHDIVQHFEVKLAEMRLARIDKYQFEAHVL